MDVLALALQDEGAMNTARSLLLLASLTGLTSLGCADPNPKTGGATSASTGSVDIALVQGGVTINTVSYQITGPNSYSKTGTFDVSNSTTLSGIIGGIPAGNGFTINLSATGADGRTTCGGSATFNVTAGAVTNVSVTLDCHQPSNTGSISVNATS